MAKDQLVKKTIAFYDSNTSLFVSSIDNANMSDMCDKFLHYVSSGVILDLGCGTGRDAKYFLQHGVDVVAIDGSEKLCEIASNRIGKPVRCILFSELDYDNTFDGVWACASLLHVPLKELESILLKVGKAMKKGGYFYVSFKYGNFEGFRGDRYFCDLTEESIKNIINNLKVFVISEIIITNDVRPERTNEKWLNVILRKI